MNAFAGGTLDLKFIDMVRFYRVSVKSESGYSLVDYFLDPSEAASCALAASRTLPRSSYLFISQIDVYLNHSECHEFLRVDGQA